MSIDSVGLERIGRYGSVPSRSMPWRAKPAAQDVGQRRVRARVHLVDDRAEDLHAVAREQRMVEHDLVDRPPDAGLARR